MKIAQDREVALPLHSAFLDKLLWGGKVVGLRVALANARTSIVGEFVRKAWSAKAPKPLQRALTAKEVL